MAEETLQNIQAIQSDYKASQQDQQLKGASEEVKKALAELVKNVAGALKESNGLMDSSIKNFMKNQEKSEKRKLQLSVDHYTEELKKRFENNKKLTELRNQMFAERLQKEKEHYQTLKKEYIIVSKERERLEKVDALRRISQNKIFFSKVDESFKKMNDRTAKVAGKLDSVFGTNFFGSLQKLSSTIMGIGQSVFKLGIGGAKFMQTAFSKSGGIGKALQATKLGQGVRKAERSFRQTKIGARKGIQTFKKFMGGGESEKMQQKRDKQEQERFQNTELKTTKRGAEAGVAAVQEQTGFFKWLKKQWLLKMMLQMAHWAWEKSQGLLNFLQGGRGAAGKKGLVRTAAQMGRIQLKKAFRTGAGKFLGGTKGGLPTKLLKSGLGISGAIGGIQGLIKGVKEFGDVAKKEGSGMAIANVSKNLSSGILSGLTLGLVSPKTFNKFTDIGTKWTSKLLDALSPSQKTYDKMSEWKTGLSKRAIETGKQIESIMEKTGIKTTSSSAMKQVMADKEKWNKLTKEEQELVSKRVQNAEKRQQAVKKSYAQGTAGTGTPKKTTDLFREAQGMENLTIHGGEKYAVLNKDQWDKVKGKLDTLLPTDTSLSSNVNKATNKAINKTLKTLGGSIKNLYNPKKSDAEKKNQDEDIRKYGGEVNKGAYKLKDSNVDIERLPFKNKLEAMIAERFKLTGKKTQINSGYRSYEDQERVYREMPDRAAKPGRSPHGPPNPRAVDMNSTDVADMVSLGLIQKYGFKYPVAKTKAGQWETWHIQAQKGAMIKDAPREGRLDFHKGEGVIVDKPKAISTMMQYAEVGKKISDMASGAIKNISYAFTKDMPGQAVKSMQRGDTVNGDKNSEMVVKLLTEIRSELQTGRKETKEKQNQKEEKSPKSAVTTDSKAGSGNFTQKETVFPSDTLMTNMYAMMTQFSGGY